MSAAPRLQATGLVRSFASGDGTIEVLRGASLAAAPRTITAITGRSGAGKTTLLGLLLGLDRPDAGSVVLDDVDLGTLDDAGLAQMRRTSAGYVPQAPSLLAILSAAENVELPLRLLRTPASGRDARVAAALDAVGLLARRDHRPDELSGGEQQRAAIARALVARPPLLVADEPTAQLDHDTAAMIAGLLRATADRDGTAMVVATNDPAVITVADVVLELREGRLESLPDR